MSRTKSDPFDKKLIGARLSAKYQQGKKEGRWKDLADFAELIPVSRQSVYKWMKGKDAPNPHHLKRICDVLGVGENYFSTENATHDEQYNMDPVSITQVLRKNIEFAEAHGLNMDFAKALTQIIDFSETFPVYSPISRRVKGKWERSFNRDSAPIDGDLQHLQVVQDGKTITFHNADFAFLKEVQDQVADYVMYLFYRRRLEMKREVEQFNADLTPEDLDEYGQIRPEFIRKHDRFTWVFEDIVAPDQKEGK